MNEIIKIFEKTGALLNGHFRLTSGLHSAIYFQCAIVLQYPNYCQLLAEKIVNFFRGKKIDLVLSPAIGGIIIGQEVGRQLGVRTIFAEREAGRMHLRRGFEIEPGENVLICEDVVTTGTQRADERQRNLGKRTHIQDLVLGRGLEEGSVGRRLVSGPKQQIGPSRSPIPARSIE